jgi:hypothetical protein
MQKLLITKFGKQITREEADDMTMGDCIALFENGIFKIEKTEREIYKYCKTRKYSTLVYLALISQSGAILSKHENGGINQTGINCWASFGTTKQQLNIKKLRQYTVIKLSLCKKFLYTGVNQSKGV